MQLDTLTKLDNLFATHLSKLVAPPVNGSVQEMAQRQAVAAAARTEQVRAWTQVADEVEGNLAAEIGHLEEEERAAEAEPDELEKLCQMVQCREKTAKLKAISHNISEEVRELGEPPSRGAEAANGRLKAIEQKLDAAIAQELAALRDCSKIRTLTWALGHAVRTWGADTYGASSHLMAWPNCWYRRAGRPNRANAVGELVEVRCTPGAAPPWPIRGRPSTAS